MRFFIASTSCLLFLLGVSGCEQNGTCQSGPKYGTQCYGQAQQTTYASGGQQESAPQNKRSTPMPSTPAR